MLRHPGKEPQGSLSACGLGRRLGYSMHMYYVDF